MKKLALNNRGDTIIEVVLAMSILMLVLFSSWLIVNRSSQLSLAARRRVEMVNQLKEQAEVLQSLRNQDPVTFASRFNAYGSLAVAPSENPCTDAPGATVPTNSFYISVNEAGTAIEIVPGVKAVKGDSSNKVWVQKQAVGTGTNNAYIDFYVRACWPSTGSRDQDENSHFVVRINQNV